MLTESVDNRNDKGERMVIKRILKFAIVLTALVVFAPVYIPYAAWSISGEDK